MTQLDVRAVSKAYGGVQALRDVSFSVQKGEILGLMGANGAGKTTLFGVIAGHTAPTRGEITFEGRRLNGLRPDRICRLGIARTFQIVRPFRGLSVHDNAMTAVLFGRADRVGRRQATALAEEALADVGLARQARLSAGTLTLSDQKRLEVAKALATGPRVLMLDEVMAGLTPTEVKVMLKTLRRLKEKYALTILIVEHVMRALMELSDRVVVLHHGELIAAGAPAAVADDPAVRDAYFGAAS